MKGKYSGYSYQTEKGNVLTAVEYYTKNQKGRYVLTCSICSIDTEVFPKGSIETSSDSVKNHSCVCGCGTTYRWDERQYRIRIVRRCKELNYEFLGFVGKYENYKTKLKLYNPSTSNFWDSTSIQTFLLNNVKDPLLGLENSIQACSKPDEYFIKNFISTGRFLEGTVFSKIEAGRWSYICPKCSFDDFVQGGVCTGVFESSQGHLSNGKLSCRCDRYKSTPEQVTYLIKKKLKEVGGTFLSWVGKVRSKRNGQFEWYCSEGHYNKSNVTYFLKSGNCKTCCANGYKNHLPAYLYLVLWMSVDKSYSCIKYGITNISTQARITRQKLRSDLIPTLLYEFYHEDGVLVENCEKMLKSDVGSHFCSRELLPRGFTETVENTEDTIQQLLSTIKSYNLTPVDK